MLILPRDEVVHEHQLVKLLPRLVDYTSQDPLASSVVLSEVLKLKWEAGQPYSWIGSSIMVSTNPLRDLNLYSKEIMDAYASHATNATAAHVYELPRKMCSRVRAGLGSQIVILQGMRGSGKTEASKKIVDYFVHNLRFSTGIESIEAQFAGMMANAGIVFDMFTTCCTSLNMKSSRCNKYIQFFLDPLSCCITNVKFSTYVLERSRAPHAPIDGNSSNFRVLHQLVQHPSYRDQYSLGGPFHMIPANIGDDASLDDTINALSAFVDTNQVIPVMAGLLHLSNLTVSTNDQSSAVLHAAKHLDISPTILWNALRNKTPDQKRPDTEFTVVRDTFIASVWESLVQFLVESMNDKLGDKTETAKHSGQTFVGILDPCGFEPSTSLKPGCHLRDKFERLLINTTNEELNHIFLKQLSQELEREGHSKPSRGMVRSEHSRRQCQAAISILDQSSKLNHTVAQSLESFRDDNLLIVSTDGSSERSREPGLLINHFASDATYDLQDLFSKNKSQVFRSVVELFENSTLTVLSHLSIRTKAEKGLANRSNVKAASDELRRMCHHLDAHDIVWLICINPRPMQLPENEHTSHWSEASVVDQVQSSSIATAAESVRDLLRIQMPIDAFFEKFAVMLPSVHLANNDLKESARQYLEKHMSSTARWAVTESEIALSEESFADLEQRLKSAAEVNIPAFSDATFEPIVSSDTLPLPSPGFDNSAPGFLEEPSMLNLGDGDTSFLFTDVDTIGQGAGKMAELLAENEEQQSTIKLLREQLSDARSEISRCLGQLENAELKIGDADRRLSHQDIELVFLRKRRNDIKDQMREKGILTQENQDLKVKNERLCQELERGRRDAETLGQQLQDAKEEISTLVMTAEKMRYSKEKAISVALRLLQAIQAPVEGGITSLEAQKLAENMIDLVRLGVNHEALLIALRTAAMKKTGSTRTISIFCRVLDILVQTDSIGLSLPDVALLRSDLRVSLAARIMGASSRTFLGMKSKEPSHRSADGLLFALKRGAVETVKEFDLQVEDREAIISTVGNDLVQSLQMAAEKWNWKIHDLKEEITYQLLELDSNFGWSSQMIAVVVSKLQGIAA